MTHAPQHPHEKHGRILRDIRQRIVTGQWPAGMRIPIRPELAAQFGTTVVTIQKALQRLIDDGFVVSRGRIGTFVASALPHLSHYAVVFPSQPGRPDWTHLHDIFLRIAADEEKLGRRKTPVYLDTQNALLPPDQRPLLRDALTHKLAGALFIGPPPAAIEPLRDIPHLHLAAYAGFSDHPRVPAVATDSDSFNTRAIELLLAKKRRSVAIIRSASQGPELDDERPHGRPLRETLLAHGFHVKPHWVIPIHAATPQGARVAVALLMDRPPEQRPDTLLVADDHLIQQTALGLLDAGVRVPDDLLLLSHCNYPFVPPCPLPVTWLGFDLRRVFRACLDAIDRQRAGQGVPPLAQVAAQFAHEIPAEPARPAAPPPARRRPRAAGVPVAP